jgi:hypothetical protein
MEVYGNALPRHLFNYYKTHLLFSINLMQWRISGNGYGG